MLIVLIGRAAACCLKEGGRFKNIDGNGNRWFNKRFLVFVEFAGAARILQNSIVFVNDIVLLSQGFSRLLESVVWLIYVLKRLHGNKNSGPKVVARE